MTATGALAVTVTAGILAGCGSGGSATGSGSGPATVDEVAAHDGRVCPQRLPAREDPDEEFGTHEPADSAPSLLTPESGWVCRYDLIDVRPEPDGDGPRAGWVLQGPARAVDPARLRVIERHLAELVPAERDRLCPADLGPRWLLVYSHGNDLTGAVLDDFGCQDVRLTDEPFHTVPGDAAHGGAVPGVLKSPSGLLKELRRRR